MPFGRIWEAGGGPAGFPHDCGPVLCVTNQTVLAGVDPATGRTLWSSPAWQYASVFDDRHLFAGDRQDDPEAAMLEPRTGRVLSRLGHTFAVGQVLLRADTKALGRIAFDYYDPAADVVRMTGAAVTDGAAWGCVSWRAYVACSTAAGPTKVWKVPIPRP